MIETLYFLYQYCENDFDNVEITDLEQIIKDFDLLLDNRTEEKEANKTTINIEVEHDFPWEDEYTKDIISIVSEYVEDLDSILSEDD